MGKRQTHTLSDIKLRQYMRAGKPIAKSDGAGLTFTLSEASAAAWILRFSHGGRRHELTLGRYPDLTLGAARKLAAARRVEVQQGISPAAVIRKEKARKDWTVRQLIADYDSKVMPSLAASTQRSYSRNLKRIQSGIGAINVRDVTAGDIVGQIERIKAGWVELFTLWCVLKAIFKHATGKKVIDSNPCAGVVLESIIGKRPEVRKRLMLSDDEIHILMNAKMSDENRISVCILLATGVRISELMNARREHLFLDEARWHIPSSKTGPAMDIPLAPVVVEWFRTLDRLAGASAYILPARKQPGCVAVLHGACSKKGPSAILCRWARSRMHRGSGRCTPSRLESAVELRLSKKRAGRFENFVGAAQFLDLALQRLEAFALAAGQTLALPAVDLFALDPVQQRLRYAANLGCDGFNDCL